MYTLNVSQALEKICRKDVKLLQIKVCKMLSGIFEGKVQWIMSYQENDNITYGPHHGNIYILSHLTLHVSGVRDLPHGQHEPWRWLNHGPFWRPPSAGCLVQHSDSPPRPHRHCVVPFVGVGTLSPCRAFNRRLVPGYVEVGVCPGPGSGSKVYVVWLNRTSWHIS